MHILDIIKSTRGKFFSVEFTKKDGTCRKMTARLGVSKFVTGAGLKFDPESRGLVTVYEPRKKAYRFVNINTITKFHCGKQEWSAAQ